MRLSNQLASMGKLLARPGFRHQRDPLAVGFLLACACLFALFMYTPYFSQQEEEDVPTTATWGWHTTDPIPDPSIPRPSFRDLALQFGSPELNSNQYHFMYEKYLPSIRDRPIKLLKIGLGCETFTSAPPPPEQGEEPEAEAEAEQVQEQAWKGQEGVASSSTVKGGDQQKAPEDKDNKDHQEGKSAPGKRDNMLGDISTVGASYHTMTTYFSKLSLTYIEDDAACAETFTSRHDKALVFVGNRDDDEFLERFSRESTVHGLFNVIIDGGGPRKKENLNENEKDGKEDIQVHTMRSLWPIVRPGGVYFVEGVQVDNGKPSFGNLVDEILWGDVMVPEAGEVRSIDCMEGICAFFKKDEGTS